MRELAKAGPRHLGSAERAQAFRALKAHVLGGAGQGIKFARKMKLQIELEDWLREKEAVKEAILTRGFSKKLNSFVQSFADLFPDPASRFHGVCPLLVETGINHIKNSP